MVTKAIPVIRSEGRPWRGQIHLVLPTSGGKDVSADSEGVIRLEPIDTGNVEVSIDDLDAGAWKKG
jgi:hypothetical protein